MAWPKGKPRKPPAAFAAPSDNRPEKPGDTVNSPDPSIDSFAQAIDAAPAPTPCCPATLAFEAVLLEFEVARIGGTKGLATSNTARFSRSAGNTVTLDVATGLVHIGHKNGGAIIVPRERVKYFEPLDAA